jgi:glycosyltransferase involved in cell wall biosynthesis
MKISLIIPVFNESKIIQSTLSYYNKILSEMKIDYEIIVGDDGSSDDTLRKAEEISKGNPKIRIIRNKTNIGRGSIISKCFKKASCEFCGYVDADLLIYPQMFEIMIKSFEDNEVVVGTKHKHWIPGYSFTRKVLSIIYGKMANFVLKTSFSDYQAGFKFFRKKSLLKLLEKTEGAGWSWDTEILYHALKENLKTEEIPLLVKKVCERGSKVKMWKDSFIMLKNLFLVQRK